MFKSQKDHSDYTSYVSNCLLVTSLFGGFTFAAITILVTQLPDISQVLVQGTLFFLAVLLDVFIFGSFYLLFLLQRCVGNLPSPIKKLETRGAEAIELMIISSFGLWGLAIVFMFLFWNSILLALASGIVWVFFIILSLVFMVKPGYEHMKRISQKES